MTVSGNSMMKRTERLEGYESAGSGTVNRLITRAGQQFD